MKRRSILNNRLSDLGVRLRSLGIFRNVLGLRTMQSILRMLEEQTPDSVGEFAFNIYRHRANISDYILKAVLEDENPYLIKKARREAVPAVMDRSVQRELSFFEELSMLTTNDVRTCMGYNGYLPEWDITPHDFRAIYHNRLDTLFTKGYGIYAKYDAFMLKNGAVTPVLTPDPQKLRDLLEYEVQRQKVIDNTRALIRGLPAANCLLYGDAGTGKSSTVKAVANEFASQGLRLIELKRSDLHLLPDVMEEIADNPLKFIIFIDDLSFSSDDADFSTLKAVLEGSVSSRSANAVIYATSNRRHLVRESFSDRRGDDIHAADTREELSSLSERFGLKVTFLKPDKDTYLHIVEHLAESYGIDMPREELFAGAESYALRRTGRSGRAARQYVESLKSAKGQG